MPSVERRNLKQKALLWTPVGLDVNGEVVVVNDPVELEVRWVDGRSESTDAQGNPVALDAKVIVKQDIAIHSIMLLGSLDDWYGTGSGSGWDENNFMIVKSFSKIPGLKGRRFFREVSLARYSSTLPVPSG